ncbi:16473_t:CDS:2 [Rhizophagus irregularis]|nr:16473_t:CDS:2 [Rhizophagus irregularis]
MGCSTDSSDEINPEPMGSGSFRRVSQSYPMELDVNLKDFVNETLVLPRCGALGKNDNSKNPVPPVEDKIVGGNENINRGTDEITIPDIDEV